MSEIGARSVVAFHFLSFFSSVSIRERARSRVFAGQVSPFLNQQLGDDDWVFVSLLLETKHVNYLTVINWPSYSRRPSVTNDTGIIARARSLAHPIRCKGEPTNREKKLGKRCTSFLSLSILCLSMFSPSAVHEGQPLGAPTSVRISSSALFNIIGPCFHSALYWFCTEFHQHNFFRGGGFSRNWFLFMQFYWIVCVVQFYSSSVIPLRQVPLIKWIIFVSRGWVLFFNAISICPVLGLTKAWRETG